MAVVSDAPPDRCTDQHQEYIDDRVAQTASTFNVQFRGPSGDQSWKSISAVYEQSKTGGEDDAMLVTGIVANQVAAIPGAFCRPPLLPTFIGTGLIEGQVLAVPVCANNKPGRYADFAE